MKILGIVIVLSASMFATDAMAARPGYTYAGLGYASHHLDDLDCSQSGLYLEGGLTLDGQLILQGRHTDVTSNSGVCGSTSTEVGVGYRNDFATASTAYAMASLINRDYGADSDAGIGISLGMRSNYRSRIELGGSISFESIDGADQLFVTVGTKYRLASRFRVTADISLNDEGNTGLSVGGRFNF